MAIPNKFLCVIPARYKSSRFPAKPLAEIGGKSMISRVWQNANNSKMVDRAIVATDDERIYEHCKAEGCEVMYTSESCNDGSARVAEVLEGVEAPYVFELQGDQPLVGPDTIDSFLKEARERIIENSAIDIVQPFSSANKEETESSDVVKVAISKNNRMILVTRHPIQSGFRTLGLYLWKRDTLLAFPKMEITEHEKAEMCHLVRFFINDMHVQGVQIDDPDWIEVDREEHIKQVEKVLKKKGLE